MRFTWTLGGAWCLAMTGCASGGAPDPGGVVRGTCPPTLAAAVSEPKFTTHVLPGLRAGCGSSTTACHGGVSPSGHVSWGEGRTASAILADLVDVTPSNAPVGYVRVAPGRPDGSWLLIKVTQDCPGSSGGGCFGHRMPLGADNLCGPAVDNLRRWIQSGAPL